MRRGFSAKFFVICLTMLGLLLIPKSVATEYAGDGTYILRPGDRVNASNGYIVELALAWGEMGSRSDWRTDIIIYNSSGVEVAYKIFFGNYTFEADTLCVRIERYIENEAVVTVSSKSIYAIPEFPSGIILPLFTVLTLIAVAIIKKNRRKAVTKTAQNSFFRHAVLLIESVCRCRDSENLNQDLNLIPALQSKTLSSVF